MNLKFALWSFKFYFNLNALLRFSLISISFLWSVLDSSAQYVRSVSATKTYTSNGTFTITDLSDITGFDPTSEIFAVANVDILLVGGGGGGGGGTSAGGGGGGEVKVINVDLNLGAELVITIGTGGNGSVNSSNRGTVGGNTIVVLNSGTISSTFRANGGGYGGGSGSNRDGGIGGSGGGGGSRITPASQAGPGSGGGTSSGAGAGIIYLNSGGNGSYTTNSLAAGAGGGGAAGAGFSGVSSASIGQGGNGGDGITPNGFTGIFGAGGGGTGTTADGVGGNGYGSNGSGGNAGASSGSKGADGVVVVNIIYRILPVEILYFNTFYNSRDRKSLLEWATGKEWQNSHFEIERSVNTIEYWETIGRVDGKGYTQEISAYSYQDEHLPFTGGNIFYRIKQIDVDGSFSYSKTKSIQVDPLLSSKKWNLYPNPTNGANLNLRLNDPASLFDQLISVSIIQMNGTTNTFSGYNPDELTAILREYLLHSKNGLYTIKINWGSRQESHKILKK
ncbi:T9SS type A sorting domain-containing protein [Algoriphagus lutimaris]|uniref:glycine-rich domain-containing protein n=1 Tax=Algoriphagus lutimaris TaxID=613197 RepID=UPI00196A32E5|nr:T9SS type A sorting domain-containing protein [Algoriphagus lutimaris]MBN3521454.1 T9SS type A sorting domain-containing protein [Algoriphagus lutimaris]